MRTPAAGISSLAAVVGLTAPTARPRYPVATPGGAGDGEKQSRRAGRVPRDPSPRSSSAESLGARASRQIDFVNDLESESWVQQLRVVLRPAKKHKFRFEYTPITYDAVGTLSAEIVFNGIRFPVTFPVTTNLQWKAYRFGYEYDFVSRDRGYVGLIWSRGTRTFKRR